MTGRDRGDMGFWLSAEETRSARRLAAAAGPLEIWDVTAEPDPDEASGRRGAEPRDPWGPESDPLADEYEYVPQQGPGQRQAARATAAEGAARMDQDQELSSPDAFTVLGTDRVGSNGEELPWEKPVNGPRPITDFAWTVDPWGPESDPDAAQYEAGY